MTILVILALIFLTPFIIAIVGGLLIWGFYIGLAVAGLVLAYIVLTAYPWVSITFILVGLSLHLIHTRGVSQ